MRKYLLLLNSLFCLMAFGQYPTETPGGFAELPIVGSAENVQNPLTGNYTAFFRDDNEWYVRLSNGTELCLSCFTDTKLTKPEIAAFGFVDKTVSNTYTSGAKQTFQSTSSNTGLRLAGVTTVPASLVNGDIWFRSTLGDLRYRENGTTRTLATLNKTQTLTNKTISGASNTITNLPIASVTNLQTTIDGKEPVFSKNSAFNKTFGTTAGTVAEGNDSRILNGQTAFGWGDWSIGVNTTFVEGLNFTQGAHTTNTDDQDGSEVLMTGYTKPGTTSDIVATDTTNEAIGKLEARQKITVYTQAEYNALTQNQKDNSGVVIIQATATSLYGLNDPGDPDNETATLSVEWSVVANTGGVVESSTEFASDGTHSIKGSAGDAAAFDYVMVNIDVPNGNYDIAFDAYLPSPSAGSIWYKDGETDSNANRLENGYTGSVSTGFVTQSITNYAITRGEGINLRMYIRNGATTGQVNVGYFDNFVINETP